MNRSFLLPAQGCPHSRRPGRRATTSLELLVAFALISGALACATPLVVAHGKLLKAQRDYRLALDELSNQLERLTALPAAEAPQALAALQPSDFTAARLHDVKLRGQLEAADLGQRMTLELSWDEPNRHAAPVRLSAWLTPQPGAAVPASED
jgi:hypothetical protein